MLAVAGLAVFAPDAGAQVGGGTWVPDSPGYKTQEKGCGRISGLTFELTCSSSSGEQRAERRYDTYSGGTHQFEGSFKITSMGGSRISLKQTFRDGSIATGATVGTSVRVNTINQVGSTHKVYINGSLKDSVSSPSGSYYDKFGSYRTASGAGPITVQWSGIQFWHK